MTAEALGRPAPQPGPQMVAINAGDVVDELLFGGARGGGKSVFLLLDFLADVGQGNNWHGILFRRSYPELEEIERLSLRLYATEGAEYKRGSRTWEFATGATLRLRYIESYSDITNYQGHSYQWIGWDELTNWPDLAAYHALKATLRGGHTGRRIRATANPGGAGHQAVRDYFVDPAPPFEPVQDEAGHTRVFIPSKVDDNQILLAEDPGYIQRLQTVGDPELVRAWLDGDWDVTLGAYFSMLRRPEVEVEPFAIPENWQVFGGLDYGEHNPTWYGLVAVDSDDDVWVLDEYYHGELGGRDHARNIRRLIDACPYLPERGPTLHLAPADMWTKRAPGEVSQALAPKDSFQAEKMHLTRANMDRVNGWRNLKDLLYHKRLKFFRGRCDRILSSLASVERDEKNPEDVKKGGDDHPADGLRYIINHVYKAREAPKPKGKAANHGETLLKWLDEGNKRKGRYG